MKKAETEIPVLTDKQAKALRIIASNPLLRAKEFAYMYFEKEQYEKLRAKVSNQGNGACRGKAAWLCAGSIVGRLEKAGLVCFQFEAWKRVTEKGRLALLEYDNKIQNHKT